MSSTGYFNNHSWQMFPHIYNISGKQSTLKTFKMLLVSILLLDRLKLIRYEMFTVLSKSLLQIVCLEFVRR